jgi:hypothetical protein
LIEAGFTTLNRKIFGQLKQLTLPTLPQDFISDSNFWMSNPHLRSPDCEALTIFFDKEFGKRDTAPETARRNGAGNGSDQNRNDQPSDEQSSATSRRDQADQIAAAEDTVQQGNRRLNLEQPGRETTQENLRTIQEDNIAWRCLIKSSHWEPLVAILKEVDRHMDSQDENQMFFGACFFDPLSPIRLAVGLCIERLLHQLKVIDRMLKTQVSRQ